MGNFRATFTKMMQAAVNNAIRTDDELYGKQLATMFEKASVVLRKRFGGRSIWQFEKPKKND